MKFTEAARRLTGRASEITPERARDYLALVAVLFTLRQPSSAS